MNSAASTSSRTPYEAGTPITTTFDPPLRDRVSFLPMHSPTDFEQPAPKGRLTMFSFRRLYDSAKSTAMNNTGMLLIGSAQGFYSLMAVCVKKLNSLEPPVPTFELILARMIITWTCCVSYMVLTKVPDPILGPKEVRWLLAFRGFVGFFGLFGFYYSLQYLSLSDSTVLGFLAPLCTTITAAIVLKESFSMSQGVAGVCSFAGVILIARPEFLFGKAAHDMIPPPETVIDIIARAMPVTPSQRLGAVGAALIGVVGATGTYTTIRAIGKRAHPMHNLVSFSSQCVIVSSILILVTRTEIVVPMQWLFVAILLAIGVLGFMAQVLLTLGLQRETAGRGTMAVYVQIIFATTFEKIFFNTTPSLLSIIGTVIIMSAAIYVAVTKENTGAKNRGSGQDMTSTEDISLQESLLAHSDDADDLDDHLPIGKEGNGQAKMGSNRSSLESVEGKHSG